jgi:hypothetical protein
MLPIFFYKNLEKNRASTHPHKGKVVRDPLSLVLFCKIGEVLHDCATARALKLRGVRGFAAGGADKRLNEFDAPKLSGEHVI